MPGAGAAVTVALRLPRVAPVQPARRLPALRADRRTLALAAVLWFGVLISRRADLLTQPHFYGEDGSVFYADVHNGGGLATIVHPLAGYLLVFQRLIGLAAQPLGLTGSAVAFALVALVVQVLPAVLFASSRLRGALPSDAARFGIASLYIVIGNDELTGHLTNAQWHLALLSFLVIIAAPPVSRAARIVDGAVLILAGLTGPYALLLLPLAALWMRRTPGPRRRALLAVLGAAALLQLVVLALSLHGAPRSHAPLGASPQAFVLIVANQLLGRLLAGYIPATALAAAACVTGAVLALLIAGAGRGPRALRYLMLFTACLAGAGLALPYGAVPGGASSWASMAYGVWGMRYFFLLPICVVCAALTLTRHRHLRIGPVALWPALFAAAIVLGAALHWQYATSPPQHLDRYQAMLAAAPPGRVIDVPIAPPGWTMTLVSR